MNQDWQVLESKVLISRPWMTLHEQRVLLPNGHQIDQFHLVESPSWTAVLALTADFRAVMVRQYRHGAGTVSLELPAGVIDAGETPEQAARRELLEETGYAAERFFPLLTAAPEPSRGTQMAHFFFAPDAVERSEQRQELSENIEVVFEPAATLADRAVAGDMIHGMHVAAILMAERLGLLPMGRR